MSPVFNQNQANFGQNQAGFAQNQAAFGQNQAGLGQSQAVFGQNQAGFGQNQAVFGDSSGFEFGESSGSFDAQTGVWGPPPPYSPQGRNGSRFVWFKGLKKQQKVMAKSFPKNFHSATLAAVRFTIDGANGSA